MALLGKGTYAKVYVLDNKSVVKVAMRYEEEDDNLILNSHALREVIFLTTYPTKSWGAHIARLLTFDFSRRPPEVPLASPFTEDKFKLTMERGGCRLSEWVRTTSSLNRRLTLLPLIIVQIASVLAYLEVNQLIHGDLSLANILIDAQHHVRVIDWGALIYEPGVVNLAEKPGMFIRTTKDFESPEMHRLVKAVGPLTHKHDIFSLGMCIWVTLTCKFPGDRHYPLLESKRDVYPIPQAIRKVIPNELLDLIEGMLRFDVTKRLSAKDVLAHPALASFIKPLFRPKKFSYDTTTAAVNYMPQQKELSLDSRESIIDWMYRILELIDIKLFVLSVSIMDRYLSLHEIKLTDFPSVAGACMILAESLLEDAFTVYSDWVHAGKDYFTFESLHNSVDNILETLKCQLYRPLFDAELRRRDEHKVDYNVIKCICLAGSRSVNEPIADLVALYDELLAKPASVSTLKIHATKYLSKGFQDVPPSPAPSLPSSVSSPSIASPLTPSSTTSPLTPRLSPSFITSPLTPILSPITPLLSPSTSTTPLPVNSDTLPLPVE